MPPDRKQRNKHHKKTQRGPIVRPDGTVQHKIPALEARDAAQLPGVNKLKAQLRQARRLLAKDKLDSGIKVATERRIKSLENDLRLAERRGVEKKNGQKYHAVKFFERQKLLRFIKRTSKEQAEYEAKGKEKKAKKSGEKLVEARIMLNYVLNFPNTQKYISLFPVTEKKDDADADDDEGKFKLPRLLSKTEDLDKSAQRRLEILLETKRLMEAGELSDKPEVERRSGVIEVGSTKDGEEIVEEESEEKEEADDFFDSD
ncbi:hypothetical protein A1Q1_01916 [Trichosporon asahii var. asahii CBS 2479]|uniref:rRNA-processing protein EFG1 n=1 Tax=Trichosporon asahii var. asahii (strain ATCC 90039 / CBS 2479 / JCM 2466 / KCTC 7840 / NBRC 103889/ NCYC 2677 / UAMH 7654) TaxID=1186058 RepID=J4UD53_TRIAS|nr:hypothetical protein A1Q1_01916 [Trichosporon asahii var. asahii CBS 2479]EJT49005.1 hypothetical protein A1Q1_01916 [Trichosporon asahii var. asahii CBS 2479]